MNIPVENNNNNTPITRSRSKSKLIQSSTQQNRSKKTGLNTSLSPLPSDSWADDSFANNLPSDVESPTKDKPKFQLANKTPQSCLLTPTTDYDHNDSDNISPEDLEDIENELSQKF